MSIIAVARAEDLLANKQERANAMVQSGTAGGQKYVNILIFYVFLSKFIHLPSAFPPPCPIPIKSYY